MQYVYPDADCRLLTPLPRTARQARQVERQPDLQRIGVVSKLGTPPYVRCWCSATLTLDYSPTNGGDEAMTARLTAFLDNHESCRPMEENAV